MKPGYKQTEAGIIPDDWALRPMLSAVRVANGQVDPKVDPFRSMILVAPDHIESGTGRLLKQETAADQRAISGKYVFSKGDIVYSKIRPYLRKAILADFDGLCSADMYPLKPAADISTGFIFATILGHRFSKYAESVSVRSGMPKINRTELADYSVALPPTKAEQEAIAAALSDADALIESLKQLLTKKRQLKQGAMQVLLTGKNRLPGFTEHWRTATLHECGEVVMGQSPPGSSYNRSGFGSPLINGPTEFTDRSPLKIQWTTQPARFCRPGDLLICVRGSSTGRTNYANDTYAIGRGVAAIRARHPHVTAYLSHQVISGVSEILAAATGSTFPSVDGASFRKLPIPLPQPDEQQAIATVLSDIASQIVAIEEKSAKVRQLKEGMMQQLLTGRIRFQ